MCNKSDIFAMTWINYGLDTGHLWAPAQYSGQLACHAFGRRVPSTWDPMHRGFAGESRRRFPAHAPFARAWSCTCSSLSFREGKKYTHTHAKRFGLRPRSSAQTLQGYQARALGAIVAGWQRKGAGRLIRPGARACARMCAPGTGRGERGQPRTITRLSFSCRRAAFRHGHWARMPG